MVSILAWFAPFVCVDPLAVALDPEIKVCSTLHRRNTDLLRRAAVKFLFNQAGRLLAGFEPIV